MNCQYSPLPDEALLHVTGPQALAFLQGQTTCDTRQVDASHALPGAYCTPQGRVICDFLLCQLGPEHYALRLRRDIRGASAAIFAKYIVFSRARLDAEDERWQVLACWGEAAAARLQAVFGGAPREQYAAHAGEGFVLVQIDPEGRQFECYLDDADGADWRERLDAACEAGDPSNWRALQVGNGIARIEAATMETFVPQMLNYDLTGHISFRKGCYTGQEVIARLHYRGQAKRRMYLARLVNGTATAAPRAGTPLFNAGDERAAGTVVNGAGAPRQGIVALVVAPAPAIAAGLRLGAPDGPPLEAGELPYSLPA